MLCGYGYFTELSVMTGTRHKQKNFNRQDAKSAKQDKSFT